jgi:hypothetical protein
MIRAKFRCISVTFELSGRVRAELKPVDPKVAFHPDGAEENRAFWDATPAGEATFRFKDEAAAVAAGLGRPGGYFYLDMFESLEDSAPFNFGRKWLLDRCKAVPEYKQLDVSLSRGWSDEAELSYGEITMSILNGSAGAIFARAGTGSDWALRVQPAPGGHRNMTFTGSDAT